jgi:hypothetical protein
LCLGHGAVAPHPRIPAAQLATIGPPVLSETEIPNGGLSVLSFRC